ncbi:hypothetical protein YC2023_035991 [Brassica napus]
MNHDQAYILSFLITLKTSSTSSSSSSSLTFSTHRSLSSRKLPSPLPHPPLMSAALDSTLMKKVHNRSVKMKHMINSLDAAMDQTLSLV